MLENIFTVEDKVLESERSDRYVKVLTKCNELRAIIATNDYLLARAGIYEDLLFTLDMILECELKNDTQGVLVQINYIIDELHSQLID